MTTYSARTARCPGDAHAVQRVDRRDAIDPESTPTAPPTPPAPGRAHDGVEVVLPDAIVHLDGRVLEVHHRLTGTSQRWHVDHVSIVVTPRRRGGVEYRFGVDVAGTVINGIRVNVPEDADPQLRDLLQHARSRRTPSAT